MVSNQRERILDGVAEVCASVGYSDMAVADITRAAGVSRKTFYEHFANKEQAFLAAYDEVAGQLLTRVRAAFRASGAFEEGVVACLQAFLETVASEPAFAQMCIVEVLAAGPEAVERRTETMHKFGSLIARGAELGMAGRAPPGVTAEALVGGIFEIVYARVLDGRADELPGLLPDLAFTVMLPYGGQAAAERVTRIAEEALARS